MHKGKKIIIITCCQVRNRVQVFLETLCGQTAEWSPIQPAALAFNYFRGFFFSSPFILWLYITVQLALPTHTKVYSTKWIGRLPFLWKSACSFRGIDFLFHPHTWMCVSESLPHNISKFLLGKGVKVKNRSTRLSRNIPCWAQLPGSPGEGFGEEGEELKITFLSGQARF